MDHMWSSPADPVPELIEPSATSDIETDDSSKVPNRLFVHEEKQLSSETESPLSSLPQCQRYTERRMGQRWASPADLLPELTDVTYESDIDTDDSSKVLNRLFIEDNRGPYDYDPTPSIESEESERFIVTADTINNLGSFHNKENSDPIYQLVVARSLFEERLKQRERELLKTPASCRLLEILSGTILSPVSSLLIKLNAPNEWRTCVSCEGFLQTHCCLRSQWLREYNKSNNNKIVYGFRRLPSLSDVANGAYVQYNDIEDDEEEQYSFYRVSSEGPEREFSQMGYLFTSRKTSYKASNTNERLTLTNLHPKEKEARVNKECSGNEKAKVIR